MQDSLKNLIDSTKSILIVLPTDPTFDEVAASSALYLALFSEAGKEVNIFCPTPMMVEFNRLIGVNKIKSELANKNLIISFDKSYNSEGIEKVSYDIENAQLKLVITPKPHIAPPAQNQLLISYTGIAAETVILVGGKDESSFIALKSDDLKEAKLVHIGISELNITGRNISSFATIGSSISEVTANLIKNSGYALESDIATNLLMGIEETTQSFSTNNVDANTFTLVADLMRAGGKRLSQGQIIANEFPSGAIPGMPQNIPSSWTEPKIFKGTSVS